MPNDMPARATEFQLIGFPLGYDAVAGCWYDATSGPVIAAGVVGLALGLTEGDVEAVDVALGLDVADDVGVAARVAGDVALGDGLSSPAAAGEAGSPTRSVVSAAPTTAVTSRARRCEVMPLRPGEVGRKRPI
jgi:hypothetical protein